MEDNEKRAQETYMRLQVLEQSIKQVQKQLELLTHQILELTSTSKALDDFNSIKPGKKILVPLSSGIFARAAIDETSGLLVNVGANVVVKKDVQSTKKLISSQVEDAKKIQKQMFEELQEMANKAAELESHLRSIIEQ